MRALLEAPEARGHLEGHAAAGPFAKLGEHIFGDEGDLRMTANELELVGAGFGSEQGEICRAVGRGDSNKGATGLDARVEDELEAEAVHVEVQAAVEIANEDGDGLKAEVGVVAIEANRGFGEPVRGRVAHREAL